MEPCSVHKPVSAILLATIAVALLLRCSDNVAAQTVPSMTIQIYNNTDTSKTPSNIYPVLTTGASSSSLWLQAWLKIPKAEMGNKPYPKLHNFRIYINPTGKGIPPGGSVSITLPLLTQLVPTDQVNPKETDQYIDWWGGGRVELFEAPAAEGHPPAALTALFSNRPNQTTVSGSGSTPVPLCADCQPQTQPPKLTIYKDTGGTFKNNEPTQLTEYTLGAINQNKDPFELNPNNVDFDVSYVDTAFLPVAMAPYNTKLPSIAKVGYVGTPQPIDSFRKALNKFVAAYPGWPQFIDSQGNKILKLPSVQYIMAGDADLTQKPWPPIDKLLTNWKACLPAAICDDITAVKQLFQANYTSYNAVFPKNCDSQKKPVVLTDDLLLSHVYGFTPFVENCASTTVNLLEATPGYTASNSQKFHQIKNIFDKLQKAGDFDPYVTLIHGADYINAPNTYAYSVDDAVGNMQADGTGFIIAIGGTRGLPNPNPAAPPVNVNFGYSAKDTVHFERYGICTATPDTPVDPDFPSIGLSVLAENLNKCPISLIDNHGKLYTLKLKSGPPYLFENTKAPIDCDDSKAPEWCNQIFAYSAKSNGTGPDASYVITPAPQQPQR
jgi:hypothetical protein